MTPVNDLNFVYDSLMNVEDFYKKNSEQYPDRFLFLCHLIGCKVKSIKELQMKDLSKIDALAMHIVLLNKDTQVLSADKIVDLKARLMDIKKLLIKCLEGTFNINKLYSGDKCIVTDLTELISLADMKVLSEGFFNDYWSYNTVGDRVEMLEGSDMDETRACIDFSNNELVAIKNKEKITPSKIFQVLSENYSDADIHLSDNRLVKSAYKKIKKQLKNNDKGFSKSIAWSYIKFVSAKEFSKLRNKKLCEGIKVSTHNECPLYIVSR